MMNSDSEQPPIVITMSPADLKKAESEAVLRDRVELYKQVRDSLLPIVDAIEQLPYKVAKPGLRAAQDALDIISDPLGEHFSNCDVCGEPIFVQGKSDDDCESGLEEGGYAHRTCMDRLRIETPERFRHVEDDPDFSEVE